MLSLPPDCPRSVLADPLDSGFIAGTLRLGFEEGVGLGPVTVAQQLFAAVPFPRRVEFFPCDSLDSLMPPEPVPWDRKDFFRPRKHERSEPSFSSADRWRDSSTTSSSSHYPHREFSRRGSGNFRRPPGHGKQGSWHRFSEGNCHGYAPSWSSPRVSEDDHYRPNVSRGDGRYNGNGRDTRISFSQRDWKSSTWEISNGSSSTLGRPSGANNDQRAVDDRPSHPSDPPSAIVYSCYQPHNKDKACPVEKPFNVNNDRISADERLLMSSNPHSDPDNSQDQPCCKDQHDNMFYSHQRAQDVNNGQNSVDDSLSHPLNSHSDLAGTWDQLYSKDQEDKTCGLKGLTGKRCESEKSLGSMSWKHLRWTHSGSLSSRGSGFSHSSSSKSLGAVDSSELKTELLPKDATSIQSPSGDVVSCPMSGAPSDETSSRKKPRLGWGEGLAKYEKKKVEGPDENASKGGSISVNSAEELHLHMNLVDKSPIVVGSSNNASPATPSSVTGSSSPDAEDKSSGKATIADNDVSNSCKSPSLASHNQTGGTPFNLEKLDNSAIANLGYLLNELLHSDDSVSMDSSFVRSTAINKVIVWKADIMKALEVTESEIDLLESKLKALKSESGSFCSNQVASSSFPSGGNANLSEQHAATYSLTPCPPPLKFDPCAAEMVEKMAAGNVVSYEVCNNAEDEGVASPGTAASNLCELPSLVKASALSDFVGHGVGSPGTATSNLREPPSLMKAGTPSDFVGHVECMLGTQAIRTISSFTTESHASGCGGDPSFVKKEIVNLTSRNISLDCDGDEMLCHMIFASNKESAGEASEAFNKLLPRQLSYEDNSGIFNISSCSADVVKQKVIVMRQFLRFKERVLALRYKAFRHRWKEDMHLLSIRKFRSKSQKKCESSLRIKYGGHLKHGSSIRLRFSSPVFSGAGNVSLVPTTELVNLSGKLLLSDSELKPCRDQLRMPALILDEKEKVVSRFISCNGLVEDPCAVERERSRINAWTSEEKEIFLDKLATYGKDFRKIASFLDHKTTADCVEFYYKNHKSDCFEKTKKKLDCSKQGTLTYMVAPGKRWKHEIDAASPDILGAVSLMAACARKFTANRRPSSKRIVLRGCSSSTSQLLDDNGFIEHSHRSSVPEKETVAADVLAGICGLLSSEAMSSCITNSVDARETYEFQGDQKVDVCVKESWRSCVTQNDDEDDGDDTCSEESSEQMDPHHWTDEEKSSFMKAFSSYGKDFSMISRFVRTRSPDQCRVFFSKLRKRLGLDSLHPLSGKVRISPIDDANVVTDFDEACVLETSSSVCRHELATKMDGNLLSSPGSINQEDSGPVRLKTDLNRSEQENGMAISCLKEAADLMDSDACYDGDKLGLVSEDGSNIIKNVSIVDNQSQQAQQTESNELLGVTDKRNPSTGQDMSVSMRVSLVPSFSNNVVNAAAENLSESSKKDSDDGDLLPPVTNLNNQDSLTRDTTNNLSHQAEDRTSSGCGFSECLHQVPIGVSMEDPLAYCLPREDLTVISNSESSNSHLFVEGEKPHQDGLSSMFNVEMRDKWHECRVYHKQNDLLKPFVNDIESFQVLWGSSHQTPIKKEMNREIDYGKLTKAQNTLKSSSCIIPPHPSQDFSLRKCCDSTTNGSTTKHSNKEHRSGHPSIQNRSLSDSAKPHLNGGDVKLFGTILTSKENENKETGHPRQNGRSSTQKVTSYRKVNGNPTITSFDHVNQSGLQNVPITSYGFWDGNRIRTGFSTLPDSATLLAKYPDAFGNYSASSFAFEQQPSQSVANTNEIYSNGLSIFSLGEMEGSKGVLDFRKPADHNGSRVQQGVLSEMQEQNGFEDGVSDPVAALKLHYAKNKQ